MSWGPSPQGPTLLRGDVEDVKNEHVQGMYTLAPHQILHWAEGVDELQYPCEEREVCLEI